MIQKIYIIANVIDPHAGTQYIGYVNLADPFKLEPEKEDVPFYNYNPKVNESVQEFIESLLGELTEERATGSYYVQKSVFNSYTGEMWDYSAHLEDSLINGIERNTKII